MNDGAPWTREEELMCCAVCVDAYVSNGSNMSIDDCVERTQKIGKRDAGAIKMRIQNIKALLDAWNIKNTLPVRPLEKASKQTREILTQCLKEKGFELPADAAP